MPRPSRHPVMTLCTHKGDTLSAECAHTKTKTETKTKTFPREPVDGFPMEMPLWAYEREPSFGVGSHWRAFNRQQARQRLKGGQSLLSKVSRNGHGSSS